MGVRRAAEPDIRFRCVFFCRDTGKSFPGWQTDEAYICTGLLLKQIRQFFCRVFMERHIHHQLLAFQILTARFRTACSRLVTAAAAGSNQRQSGQGARSKSLPFHEKHLLSNLKYVYLPKQF